MPAGQFWVTWPNISDHDQARQRAMIWGPQKNPPPQVTTPVRMFLGGPFATRADAQKYKDAIGSGNPLPPGGTPIVGSSGRGLTQTVQNAWSAATAVPRFLSMLTNGNLWLRVGEIVAGMILLGIGVNALFKGAPMKTVTKAAGVAAKVVPV